MEAKKKPTRNFEWKHAHEGFVCLSCGRVLISYFRHDYVVCSCTNRTMVDGGQVDYVRYGGMDMSLLQPVIITPVFYTKTGKPSKKKIKTYRDANNGYKG